MTHQEAILAALDALTLAVAENTRTRANEKTTTETLEARYGPKNVGLIPPEYVKDWLKNGDTCDRALYSYTEERGNVVHRCELDKGHKNAHLTRVYGIATNWYLS